MNRALLDYCLQVIKTLDLQVKVVETIHDEVYADTTLPLPMEGVIEEIPYFTYSQLAEELRGVCFSGMIRIERINIKMHCEYNHVTMSSSNHYCDGKVLDRYSTLSEEMFWECPDKATFDKFIKRYTEEYGIDTYEAVAMILAVALVYQATML